jgi:hypothetical protein
VTVEQEEEFLLTAEGVTAEDVAKADDDSSMLEAVAHHIMLNNSEKEIPKKEKKRYKPRAGQHELDAGLCKFGNRGETAVTNELCQFNQYKVFEPIKAGSLSNKKKKKALSSLIFLREKQNGDVKA